MSSRTPRARAVAFIRNPWRSTLATHIREQTFTGETPALQKASLLLRLRERQSIADHPNMWSRKCNGGHGPPYRVAAPLPYPTVPGTA